MNRISTSANGDNLSHIERRHGSGNGVTTMQDASAAALLANRDNDLRAATPGERVMISLLHEISGKLDTMIEMSQAEAKVSALYLADIERRQADQARYEQEEASRKTTQGQPQVQASSISDGQDAPPKAVAAAESATDQVVAAVDGAAPVNEGAEPKEE